MNKLSVALTLFFSGISLIVGSSSVSAKQSEIHKLTAEDMELVRQSEVIINRASDALNDINDIKINMDEFLNKEQYESAEVEAKALAKQILQSGNNHMLDENMQETQPVPKPYVEHSTLVFASLSLGEQGLKDVLAMSSGLEDVVVVFQGILEGETLTQGLTRFQKMAAQHSPMPNVIINPDLFRSYKVDIVPTIIITSEDDIPKSGDPAKPKARVAGISDPNWLVKQVEDGEVGNLGIRGPVEPISEVDLIEMAQQRASQIDWDKQKEQAQANFWKNQNFNELPRAPKARIKDFDPSVVITRDITTANGTVVARKGDVINPLDIRDFTQAVVVFDPLDKKQRELVLRELPRIKEAQGVSYVTIIVTRLDKEDGWDSYEEISDLLDEPVHLLTPDVRDRFELEYVPSVITAEGKIFKVEELAD